MKYKLTENSIKFDNKKLYQIQALKDFGNVKAGDLGGYVEKEDNLSQEGNCWIYDNSRVYENVWICGNAKVYNNAKVYGNAQVGAFAKVGGDVDCDDVYLNKLKINQEDKQQPPKHYDLKIQPIDYIIANNLNFAEGNIIKYVSRYKQKNGKEDLLKARYYLDLLIKEIGE